MARQTLRPNHLVNGRIRLNDAKCQLSCLSLLSHAIKSPQLLSPLGPILVIKARHLSSSPEVALITDIKPLARLRSVLLVGVTRTPLVVFCCSTAVADSKIKAVASTMTWREPQPLARSSHRILDISPLFHTMDRRLHSETRIGGSTARELEKFVVISTPSVLCSIHHRPVTRDTATITAVNIKCSPRI